MDIDKLSNGTKNMADGLRGAFKNFARDATVAEVADVYANQLLIQDILIGIIAILSRTQLSDEQDAQFKITTNQLGNLIEALGTGTMSLLKSAPVGVHDE